MPTGGKLVRTQMIGMKLSPEELEQIDARARNRGLSRTEYMVQASLGTIDVEQAETDREIAGVKARLDRLEDFAFGG